MFPRRWVSGRQRELADVVTGMSPFKPDSALLKLSPHKSRLRGVAGDQGSEAACLHDFVLIIIGQSCMATYLQVLLSCLAEGFDMGVQTHKSEQ